MPMPEGPPLTSFVASVDSACPDSDRMPRVFACAKSGVVGQAVLLEDRLERAGPPAESQRVDRQDRHPGVAGEPIVAGRLMLPPERFVQDHPQRVARRNTVTARKHKPVRVGELGLAKVVPQSPQGWSSEVTGDVVGRVGQRPAEVARLRVVPHETEVHRGHEGDVVKAFAFVLGKLDGVGVEGVLRRDGVERDGVPNGTVRRHGCHG